MKKIKLVLLFFLTVLANIYAQDVRHLWVVGAGGNIVDTSSHGLSDIGDQAKDYFTISDWNTVPLLSKISIARYLNYGLSVDIVGSLNRFEKIHNPPALFSDASYSALDLGLRYDLNHLFGDTKWFDPYVKASVGAVWVEEDMGGIVAPSLGFNTWFTDSFGLNFESAYKTDALFGDGNLGKVSFIQSGYHFQHSVSLVFRFGTKDTDKDGIIDPDDECRKITGPESLNGCPDSDGDGIRDLDDKCPQIPGSKAQQGCPDADGDGILDSVDKCPDTPGLAEFGGCPDSDGDGIPDNEDRCPNAAGPKAKKGCPDPDNDGIYGADDKCPNTYGKRANNGCPAPDTDGDGVVDTNDRCPNVKGTLANDGCPEKLSADVKASLGAYARTIQFNTAKSTFKPGVTQTLDKVVGILKEYPNVSFNVEGHSDAQGNDANNLSLSQRRAQAVTNYLVSHGISGERLRAIGYGETQPIADNGTKAGRAQNRRVVISPIE